MNTELLSHAATMLNHADTVCNDALAAQRDAEKFINDALDHYDGDTWGALHCLSRLKNGHKRFGAKIAAIIAREPALEAATFSRGKLRLVLARPDGHAPDEKTIHDLTFALMFNPCPVVFVLPLVDAKGKLREHTVTMDAHNEGRRGERDVTRRIMNTINAHEHEVKHESA